MQKQTAFQKWLITFSQEKQLDMSETIQAKDCVLQVGDVLSAMMSASTSEQKKIKQILVMIDFKNGDVMHFIRHAAQALGPQYRIDTF